MKKQRDSSQRPMVVIPYVENVSEAVARITRTVLTRRVSSYGLPAWVSSELGPMGGAGTTFTTSAAALEAGHY